MGDEFAVANLCGFRAGLNRAFALNDVEGGIHRRGMAHEALARRKGDVDNLDVVGRVQTMSVQPDVIGNSRCVGRSDSADTHLTTSPLMPMVTSAYGIVLPESVIACFTSCTSPKQQGTVMCATVMELMSFSWNIAASFSA